jgi:hypothetical protein
VVLITVAAPDAVADGLLAGELAEALGVLAVPEALGVVPVAGELLLLLLHAAATSAVPSTAPTFTGSGTRASNELVILIVPAFGR